MYKENAMRKLTFVAFVLAFGTNNAAFAAPSGYSQKDVQTLATWADASIKDYQSYRFSAAQSRRHSSRWPFAQPTSRSVPDRCTAPRRSRRARSQACASPEWPDWDRGFVPAR